MRALLLLLSPLAILLTSTVANGQPSNTAPGSPHSYPHTLALPPLPFTAHSPMPSLPPPQANETPAAPNFASGRVLSRPGFRAQLQDDARLVFGSRFLSTDITNDPSTGPRFGGSFDLTDLFGRDDPYLQEKLALLEDTFELRAEQRETHNERVMGRALGDLPAYLLAVWQQQQWDAATRRRLLFALWDECAEPGSKIGEQGAVARQIIEGFIARNLPQDSPWGYSAEELRTLNASRTSSLEFAPQ